LKEEDSGVFSSSRGTGTYPCIIGGGKAKVGAGIEALKSAIDDKIIATKTSREGNLQISLTCIYGGGLVCYQEILGQSI
jgi:hypothetical protein